MVTSGGNRNPANADRWTAGRAARGSKRYVQTYDRLVSDGHQGQSLYEELPTAFRDYDSPQTWLVLGFPINDAPEGS